MAKVGGAGWVGEGGANRPDSKNFGDVMGLGSFCVVTRCPLLVSGRLGWEKGLMCRTSAADPGAVQGAWGTGMERRQTGATRGNAARGVVSAEQSGARCGQARTVTKGK